jgi:hypothetical protein
VTICLHVILSSCHQEIQCSHNYHKLHQTKTLSFLPLLCAHTWLVTQNSLLSNTRPLLSDFPHQASFPLVTDAHASTSVLTSSSLLAMTPNLTWPNPPLLLPSLHIYQLPLPCPSWSSSVSPASIPVAHYSGSKLSEVFLSPSHHWTNHLCATRRSLGSCSTHVCPLIAIDSAYPQLGLLASILLSAPMLTTLPPPCRH